MNLGKRRPTPPGVILRDEFLKPLGISQIAFATHLGVDRKTINRLINEPDYPVTPALALSLGSALSTTPEFWLNLSSRCLLWDELNAREEKLPETLIKKQA